MAGSEQQPTGVRFMDLARIHDPILPELERALATVIGEGDFILGQEVGRFELEFAAFVGAKEAIGVKSGTAALTIAIEAAGIGPGDEVIVPAHTYVASALAIVSTGATPVFCDVTADNGLIDPDSLAQRIGERTAAIMPVHLYGQACDMDTVLRVAEKHGLAVIEDAAQAHGARWRGRAVGSFGLAAGFSFYPSKNLGAFGDAGIIVTDDQALADAARRLRNLGQLEKGDHRGHGYNERLDTLQAAVLRTKLAHLDDWNRCRAQVAAWYRELLPEGVGLPPSRSGAIDVHHLLAIRVGERDSVAESLARAGIETGVHYSPAVHRQPPFREAATEVTLTNAERWAAEELSLPIFPGLTEPEVRLVCDRLSAAIGAS